MYCTKCGINWQSHIKECAKSSGGCGNKEFSIFKTLITVNAVGMPTDVSDYCCEHEISTHYQNDIAQIYNSDNPFANWLKKNGYKFKAKPSKEGDYGDFDEIGIIAT